MIALNCIVPALLGVACGGSQPAGPSGGVVQTCSGSTALSSHAMAYDPNRRQVLVFGGVARSGALSGALWGWDGATWTCVAANGPAARTDAALAYDTRRRVLVLYGGRVGSQTLRDTWELSESGWAQKNSSGPQAGPHPVFAYDEATNASLLYGGGDDDGPSRSTWRWDGSAWTKLSDGPNTEFPDAMFRSEAGRAAMLVTARSSGISDVFSAPIYQWSNGAWVARTTSGDAPRFSPQAPAARTATGALLYAGFEASGAVTTWILDGAVWKRHTGESPSRRRGSTAVFDSNRGVVVLHGGDDGSNILDDTWEWNGTAWRKIR